MASPSYAIDHGAALYFHHSWPSRAPSPERFAAQPFDASKHVLRDVACDVAARHEELAGVLTPGVVASVVADVPDEWLEPTPCLADPASVRDAYEEMLTARLASTAWVPDRAAA